jgi:dolichol-phosphate mannosyltransferase
MLVPQINIVIPLYNESEVFHLLVERLNQLMDSSELSIEVILVDDGSKDNTALQMVGLAQSDSRYKAVLLSRNFGHQLALSAGYSVVNASEAVFVIDGDLQDPPELLDSFYSKLKEGYEVVYGVRRGRKEHWMLKAAFSLFYVIIKRIAYIDLPRDTGDFALLSRRVVDVLNTMPEQSRYLRGMRAWVGFKQTGLPYERPARAEGETKYRLRKRLSFALNGIFSFSEAPVKWISSLGMGSIGLAVLYFIYTLIKRFFTDEVQPGFTGLLFVIILFSGVQLVCIGILGEYVLRIFFQVKGRPLYIIKDVVSKNKSEEAR